MDFKIDTPWVPGGITLHLPLAADQLPEGTRLWKLYRGEWHAVDVLHTGKHRKYRYKGSDYDHLSVVARQITGRVVSGNLFFGLSTPPRRT